MSATTKIALLVDDEPPVREYVRKILDKEGFAVMEAADGIEGYDLVRKLGCEMALVVTDIKMPRMDGIAMAEKHTATVSRPSGAADQRLRIPVQPEGWRICFAAQAFSAGGPARRGTESDGGVKARVQCPQKSRRHAGGAGRARNWLKTQAGRLTGAQETTLPHCRSARLITAKPAWFWCRRGGSP